MMNSRNVIKAEDVCEDHILTNVKPLKDGGWEIYFDGCTVFYCPAGPVEPKVGSTARLYGEGLGYVVRGLDIDGREVFYRTPEEQEAQDERDHKEAERKQFEGFERNREKMDKQFAALPKVFQERILRFRTGNADFRWKFETYELFTCEEAVKIATYCKTVEAIKAFHALPYEEQLKAGISDDHSGNTFGMACRLALWYVAKPEVVAKEHGALVALVGCVEYGCTHPEKSDER